jgi:hypothetical protein
VGGNLFVVVSRPSLGVDDLDSTGDRWFIYTGGHKALVGRSSLFGEGKEYDDEAGNYDKGDRVGVLLDLNNGSLLFFKNGVQASTAPATQLAV